MKGIVMGRRDFLRLSLGGGLSLLVPSLSYALTKPYRVSFKYEMELPYQSEDVRLWLPIPIDTPYQRLLDLRYSGTHTASGIYRDRVYGAPVLYAEFRGSEKRIELLCEVEFAARRVSLIFEDFGIPDDVSFYLKPTRHIPVTGKVKEIAESEIGGGTLLERAWKVYWWTIRNTRRDPNVRGCGVGDVNVLLKMLDAGVGIGGKCTDHSSIFVALCRASGVPAREVFGLRVMPSRAFGSISIKPGSEDLTRAQHCRAEFWAGEWIPVDPADVRKLMLNEGLPLDHPSVRLAADYFFGAWDPHWVAYNWARDFVLNPEQRRKPLNELMYPYAEVDGKPLDRLSPDTFRYTIRRIA